jgi:predicted nucleotidyltransferase component of viral defense system
VNELPRQYASAGAFRVALETRLKAISTAEGIDLQRLRRQVSFDRLLARFFAEKNAPWLLKGGYAMELRLRTARTTKDIDISLPAEIVDASHGDVVQRVQQSARIELADFFTFVIGESQLDLNAAPQGGARYPVVASIAGRVFTKFHLDVGIGDAVVQPTELLKGRNWLDFAGIPPAMLMAISIEQQFAEKLHAYTLPRRDSSNSRVKDLVDMVLLARLRTMDKAILQRAISATFSLRGTHPIPANLPAPPASWTVPFLVLARECQLELTLSDALQILMANVSL